MATQTTKTAKLDIRLSMATKDTLSRAATAAHSSLSQFVLESALSRAEEMLVDRRSFNLDAEQWALFMEALDAPDRTLPRVNKLFKQQSVFENE
ncbi:type II toxin-antitoxin system TacA family antitoxin [Chlorobium ferrooxidans]|nr:DUF1778 domain-containing protein [Chlorobium ferrooxidans]